MAINITGIKGSLSANYKNATNYYKTMWNKFNKAFGTNLDATLGTKAQKALEKINEDWNELENKLEIKTSGNQQIITGYKEEIPVNLQEFLEQDDKKLPLYTLYERYVQKRLIENMNIMASENMKQLIISQFGNKSTGGLKARSGRTANSDIRADAIWIKNLTSNIETDETNTKINGIKLEVGLNYTELMKQIDKDPNFLKNLMKDYKKAENDLIPFGFSLKHYSTNQLSQITYTQNSALMEDINKKFLLHGARGSGYWTTDWAYPYMLSLVSEQLLPLIGPTDVAFMTTHAGIYPTYKLLENNFLLYHLHALKSGRSEEINLQTGITTTWYKMKINNSHLYWNNKNSTVNITDSETNSSTGKKDIMATFDLSKI